MDGLFPSILRGINGIRSENKVNDKYKCEIIWLNRWFGLKGWSNKVSLNSKAIRSLE